MSLAVFVPGLFSYAKHSVMSTYYGLLPASAFFVYHSIEPVKTQYSIGERVEFISRNDTYKEIHYYWNDRLHCDYQDDDIGFILVGVHQDNNPSGVRLYSSGDSKPWEFLGNKPISPATCYLESKTCADVGYGVKKCQPFIGDKFTIQ